MQQLQPGILDLFVRFGQKEIIRDQFTDRCGEPDQPGRGGGVERRGDQGGRTLGGQLAHPGIDFEPPGDHQRPHPGFERPLLDIGPVPGDQHHPARILAGDLGGEGLGRHGTDVEIEFLDPFEPVATGHPPPQALGQGGHRGAHPADVGLAPGHQETLGDTLENQQAARLSLGIDHRDLADIVQVEQFHGPGQGLIPPHGDHLLADHVTDPRVDVIEQLRLGQGQLLQHELGLPVQVSGPAGADLMAPLTLQQPGIGHGTADRVGIGIAVSNHIDPFSSHPSPPLPCCRARRPCREHFPPHHRAAFLWRRARPRPRRRRY